MGELEKKIGALLKYERERQGIKLEDLAESLRISLASLEHIETGNVDGLPSEIYFGLFAKSYAEALGIDYAATKNAIQQDIIEHEDEQVSAEEESGTAVKPVTGEPSEEQGKSKKKTKLQTIIIGLAILIIIIGGYFIIKQLLHEMRSTDRKKETSEPVATAVKDKDSIYTSYDWNTPEYKKPSDLVLELHARGASWATVLADGDTVIFKQLKPGRTYQAVARYRLRLSVAVPRVVDISLNGVRINPVSPTTGRISRVNITQINVDSFLTRSSISGTALTSRSSPVAATPTVSITPIPDTTDTSGTMSNEH